MKRAKEGKVNRIEANPRSAARRRTFFVQASINPRGPARTSPGEVFSEHRGSESSVDRCASGLRKKALTGALCGSDRVFIMNSREPDWLTWARELQAIAQTGLAFTRDP
jgi:Hydrolase of X-linked nucleoside diphosphate N terminal